MLGKGSYGMVYKVKYIQDDQVYVMKQIEIRKFTTKTVNMLLNELEIHFMLKDETIIKLHTAFIEENHLYMIMEYADNGDMQDILKKMKEDNT